MGNKLIQLVHPTELALPLLSVTVFGIKGEHCPACFTALSPLHAQNYKHVILVSIKKSHRNIETVLFKLPVDAHEHVILTGPSV